MYEVVWTQADKPVEEASSKRRRQTPTATTALVMGGAPSSRRALQGRLGSRSKVRGAATTVVWLGFGSEAKVERGHSGASNARSLMVVLRELSKRKWARALMIVSRLGMRVEESSPLVASQGALWGVGRTARVEYPELHCVNVDVDTVDAVWRELQYVDQRETFESGYRGGRRFVPRLEKVKRTVTGSAQQASVAEGALFVITGGFGALAQGCLSWLAEGGARGAVLVGRRGADERHMGGMVEHQAKWFQEGMVALRADASQLGDVKGMLSTLPGPMQGLLHLAGLGSASLLSKTRAAVIHDGFAVKMDTLGHLERLGLSKSVRQSVLFSSQATLLPMHGQGAYAAANAAMESFALGAETLRVSWGAFGDVGMYLGMSKKQQEAEAKFWKPLWSTGLPKMLNRALNSGRPHVGVFDVKWEAFALRGPSIYQELQREAASSTSGGLAAASQLETTNVPVNVEAAVKEVLGMTEEHVLDLDAPLQDLGFDSMLSVELSGKLSEMTGERVAATVAYDYPTVRQLKQHVEQQQEQQQQQQSQQDEFSGFDSRMALDGNTAVAISGGACRFGTARDLDALWRLFAEGSDQIVLVPAARWSWETNYGEGKSVSKWGGFVEAIEMFDAAFFGISPREAKGMDPQQRMLLECSWEALESAGQDR